MRKRTTLTALTVSALLLAGCGSGVEKDATYESPEHLAATVNKVGGWECSEDPDTYTDTREEYGWMQITCGSFDGIGLFNDAATRDTVVEKSLRRPGDYALVGRNWVVFGDQFEIEDLQVDLGGEVVGYQ